MLADILCTFQPCFNFKVVYPSATLDSNPFLWLYFEYMKNPTKDSPYLVAVDVLFFVGLAIFFFDGPMWLVSAVFFFSTLTAMVGMSKTHSAL